MSVQLCLGYVLSLGVPVVVSGSQVFLEVKGAFIRWVLVFNLVSILLFVERVRPFQPVFPGNEGVAVL